MKILGYPYKVSLFEQAVMAASGQIDTGEATIRVARDLHPTQQVSTVLHEVLEALDFHLELDLEHRVICALEAGLYQVLTDAGVDLDPLRRELEPPAAAARPPRPPRRG